MRLGQTFSPHWNSLNATIVVDQLKQRAFFKQCKRNHVYTVKHLKQWLKHEWNPDHPVFPCPKCAVLLGHRSSPPGFEDYYKIDENLYVPLKCFEDGINVLDVNEKLSRGQDGVVYNGVFNEKEVVVKIVEGDKSETSLEVAELMSDVGVGPHVYRAFVCFNCKVSLNPQDRMKTYSFLVMEKLEIQLFDYLRDYTNSQSPEEILKEIIKPLFRLIVKMHQAGVKHTDLHLENVMLNKDGTNIRIIDWDRTTSIEKLHPITTATKYFFGPSGLFFRIMHRFHGLKQRQLIDLVNDEMEVAYQVWQLGCFSNVAEPVIIVVEGVQTIEEYAQEYKETLMEDGMLGFNIAKVELEEKQLIIWYSKDNNNNTASNPLTKKILQFLKIDDGTIPHNANLIIGGSLSRLYYSLPSQHQSFYDEFFSKVIPEFGENKLPDF